MRRCMKFWNRISELTMTKNSGTLYESVFVLDFDEDGNLSVDVKKDGTVSADTLIKSLLQADRYNEIRTYAVDNDTTFVPVKNFQVVYGIPKIVRTLPMQIITPVIIIWLHPAGRCSVFYYTSGNCGICMLYV